MINKIISATAVTIAVSSGIYSYLQDIEAARQMQKFINTGARYTAQDGQTDRIDRQQADQELCERIIKLERAVVGVVPFYDIHLRCEYYVPSPTDLKIIP